MRTFASSAVFFAACIASVLFVSVPAVAVTVMPDKGDVRISTDQGFRKIETPTEVATFTRVLIAPGGRAIIYYGESCKVEVRSFATIQREPPCGGFDKPSHFGYEQSSSSLPSDTDYNFTPKVGGRAQSSRKNDDDCAFNHHTLLIIGGVAVAGGLTAILLSGGGNDRPASH